MLPIAKRNFAGSYMQVRGKKHGDLSAAGREEFSMLEVNLLNCVDKVKPVTLVYISHKLFDLSLTQGLEIFCYKLTIKSRGGLHALTLAVAARTLTYGFDANNSQTF